ncbi:MAG: hypothetical protein KJS95_12180 [Gammaproteobacteria bacterium]|nr:hypothetical protein [Gammaproteobacteria bacterium]
MPYIMLLAVVGVLVLQWTGSIPLSSVGGSMVIAVAFLSAALVVALHEAWTQKRGVVGWIVNVVVALAGAFFAAQLGGLVMVSILGLVADVNGSLARTGGAVMSAALAGGMAATVLGAWGALQIVNRWR